MVGFVFMMAFVAPRPVSVAVFAVAFPFFVVVLAV